MNKRPRITHSDQHRSSGKWEWPDAPQNTRRTAQLALLNDVSREIAGELELGALLDLAVNLVHTSFHFEHVGILTLDLRNAELRMAACAGIYADQYAKDHHLPLNQGLTAWAYHHEQTVVVNDVTLDARYVNLYPDRVPTLSELSAPIWVSGEIVGILDVQDAKKNAFDAGDIVLLETLADQLAVAIGNAQLYEALQEELRERLQAEASLRASEERLNLALEGGDLGAWDWDLATGTVIYSHRWATMLGYDPREIAPSHNSWTSRIHPDDLPHVTQALEEHLAGNTNSYVTEHRMQTAEGTWQWILARGRVLARDQEGRPLRMSGTHQDITARKKAELALQALNASLEIQVAERTAQLEAERDYTQAILETTGDAIALVDLEYKVEYVNPAFERATGFTAREALAQYIPDLIGVTPLPPPTVEGMKATAKTAEPWTGEIVLRQRTGQTYDALLQISPVRNAHGTVTGYLTSHRDISNLKALQRTQARFITNVSHELRTPIAILKLYASMLPNAPQDKRIRYEEALQSEITHLSQLVENILRINTVSTKGLRLSPTPVSLNRLIEDIVAEYCRTADGTDRPAIQLRLNPEEPTVSADVSLLTEALCQIIDNAIRYTPTSEIVKIATGYQDQNMRIWATMEVSDTGMGIPPEEQPRIFDRFYRGQQPDAEQISGTGLGLSIAKAIIELHGGHITVESKEKEGSTFTIWLQPVPKTAG